jgi:hypothetical protein
MIDSRFIRFDGNEPWAAGDAADLSDVDEVQADVTDEDETVDYLTPWEGWASNPKTARAKPVKAS